MGQAGRIKSPKASPTLPLARGRRSAHPVSERIAHICNDSDRATGKAYRYELLSSVGIAGFTLTGGSGRLNLRAVAICTIVGLGIITRSCGGMSAGNRVTFTAYTVTIRVSGSSHFSTTVTVNIQ